MTRYYRFASDGPAYPEGTISKENRVYGTPALVIDPEDREAVEELHDALLGDYANLFTAAETADAIRSLLNPKPAEPKGLGAVVRDRIGELWVRADLGWFGWRRCGVDSEGRWSSWADLDIPDESHILAFGVEVE